jgi:hypothetical protein
MTILTHRTSFPRLAITACVATLAPGTAAAAMDTGEAKRMLAEPEFRDASLVLDWSEAAIATALETAGFQTLHSNRAGPMMHLAMHDALNAIVPVYRPYAVESCMLSRIYNGFHFRAGLEAGVEMGRDRAAHILDTQLTRRPGAAEITFLD